MLQIKRKYITENWFFDRTKLFDCLKLIIYRQVQDYCKCYVKISSFKTILISLDEDIESIFEKFNKNTRYEIRRAVKENIRFYTLKLSKSEYVKYYNDFARKKNLHLLTQSEIDYYWENLVVVAAGKSLEDIVVIHSYLTDGKRARLFHSISLFRNRKDISKNFAGRANRFLHFKSIEFFKERGYEIYDLGGISKKPDSISIAKFKMNFSSNIVEEFNVVSPLLFIFLKLKGKSF